MKTNVSIKFNSIKEYREIESKLIELGYINDKEWNIIEKAIAYNFVRIFINGEFIIVPYDLIDKTKPIHNSLQEFLEDV